MTFRIASIVLALVVPTAAICEGAPSLTFVRWGGYGSSGTFQAALGDLDGDGDLDAVFANMDRPGEIWLNDGRGIFRNSHQPLGYAGHGVAIGDLDGDGDLDFLLTRASTEDPSCVFLNDGSGRFLPGQSLDDRTMAGNSVQLFDLEGDGDLDAGIYYSTRLSRVYVNDGAGRFLQQGENIPGMAAWGDLDGDGDADAIAEQHAGGFAIFLNVGDASFEDGGRVQAPAPFLPGDTALCDVDADGDLDLVCSGARYGEDEAIWLLRNDGPAGFVAVPCRDFLAPAGRVAVGDFNGDGVPDVLIVGAQRPGRIGLNDGHGGFVDGGVLFGNDGLSGIPAVGDLDSDGDLDILLAQYSPDGPSEVWLNERIEP